MTQNDNSPSSNAFAENLAAVESRIAAALKEAGRAGPVEIIAVSKMQGETMLREALRAGQRIFGENRVQEAKAKWPALKKECPDIVLHLIGPLQSNKAAEAVALFDVIQSVDRPKIAKALAEEMRRQNRRPRLFVQINTGAEPQKAGAAPEDADAFIAQCRDEFGLEIEGLMCIPPADDAPAPHFALLAKIAQRNNLTGLSMGMSGDYDIGAQLGASHVRVGTALFGARGA
ncbi:MAG TPA: YggS family pyridoxal phosphate-dependent enzyme [Parvularculaceae bacterium]|nr:YggS family pyridoxal phosphate-dependent enzyme [Parvularculaceae bacterium]HNS86671.1 YggS family pyridoxal phosphate-dependent enzyme [Parvularculaceae bacterium]